VLCPGFSESAVSRGAGLLRLMLPAAALTVVNEMLAGIHYARRRFFTPALFKVTVPLSTILLVLLWGGELGVASIAIANLVALLLQCVFSAVGVARMRGFQVYGPSAKTHEGTALLLRRIPLLVASMVVYKSLPFFDRWLASTLPVGAISILGYAGKLSGMLQPLLVSGIALSFYPVMTEFAAKRDFEALRHTLGRSLRLALFVSVPVAAYLAVFGGALVVFLLGRGAFTVSDARETHRVFALLLLALPAMLGGTLVGQGFYALKETKTVIRLGLVETVLYILLCLVLLPVLGLYAIPVTKAVFFTASFLAAVYLLSRLMGQNLFAEFLPALGRQFVSLAAGFIAVLPLLALLPASPWSSAVEMAFAFLVYFAVSRYVFKTHEAAQFMSLLRSFLPGRRIAGWYRGYVPPTEIES
jgi:putative peptidoglycan lipid II flippase